MLSKPDRDEMMARCDAVLAFEEGAANPRIKSGLIDGTRCIWQAMDFQQLQTVDLLPIRNDMDAVGDWIEAATHSADVLAHDVMKLLAEVEALRADVLDLARQNRFLRHQVDDATAKKE